MSPTLQRMYEEGRAAYPNVSLEAHAFEDYVQTRFAEPAALDAVEAHAADLYLVCACLSGAEDAATALDRRLQQEIAPAVARMDAGTGLADDVLQVLADKLLLATQGARPKLAEWAARGPLRRWLRVAAMRVASDLARARGPAAMVLDTAHRDLRGSIDPELGYLKEQYRHEVRAAFQEALASLDRRARTLLRFRYLDGIGFERLAAIYQVGVGTAHRWVAAARETLHRDMVERLKGRLSATPTEVESVIRLVSSQLDVSIEQVLRRQS